MPIVATTQPPVATDTGSAAQPANVELATFRFVIGWVLLIALLTFANRSRLGHVILYYGLILIILFILVTEYQQIVPFLNFQTPGQLGSAS